MNYMANRIVQSGRYFSSGAFRSFRLPCRLLHLFEPNVGCGDCKPPASSSDLSSRFLVSLVGALPHPAHALCAHVPRWVELRVGRLQHAPALGQGNRRHGGGCRDGRHWGEFIFFPLRDHSMLHPGPTPQQSCEPLLLVPSSRSLLPAVNTAPNPKNLESSTQVDTRSAFFRDGSRSFIQCTTSMTGSRVSGDCSTTASTHRKIDAYRSFSGASDFGDYAGGHGTHVAGTILGHVAVSETCTYEGIQMDPTEWSGAAPGAKIVVDDFTLGDGGLSIPNNLNDLFSYSYSRGAKIHSNSWGPSYPSGEYSAGSVQVDQFTHEHQVRTAPNILKYGQGIRDCFCCLLRFETVKVSDRETEPPCCAFLPARQGSKSQAFFGRGSGLSCGICCWE